MQQRQEILLPVFWIFPFSAEKGIDHIGCLPYPFAAFHEGSIFRQTLNKKRALSLGGLFYRPIDSRYLKITFTIGILININYLLIAGWYQQIFFNFFPHTHGCRVF